MKYALLIHEAPEAFAIRKDPPRQAVYLEKFMAYTVALRQAGVLAGGAGLKAPESATTVHLGPTQTIQDGPFADSKLQFGGFYLVDVADLDAALGWAARIPAVPGSAIEVRPCIEANE